MDEKEKLNVNKKSASKENNEEARDDNNIEEVVIINDDAGPSSFLNLPGSVTQAPRNIRPGISKSEHSLKEIITRKDVADALKMTSLSFSPQGDKNCNVPELKIPILEGRDKTKDESPTLIELKRFMVSCLKTNRDHNGNQIPSVHNINIVNRNVNDLVQTIPNSRYVVGQSGVTGVLNANELVKNTAAEPKLPKPADKRKTSGSLTERSDLCVTQRDSLSSIGSNVCRICMTRGRERLISPCNCKGSLANVHLSCLERWLNQVGRNHCELCGFSYPAIRTPRYTVLQALRLWFGNPRNRSHLQSDCLIFWLLSTVTAGLLAVCIVGTQYFVIEGNKFGISHRITETAMDFFMAIVLCGYSVTVYLLWKDHYVMWNRWRRANVNVRLLLTPDANPVPFVPRNRFAV
ncbi:uncharacterized protein [Epargyreus clarus]|uniref:uncharacterized protein isoform X2 n=1 Tax=Epargyreus clarus TaxID=520877 RepID=UPI003C2C3544